MITVNGREELFPGPLSIREYLDRKGVKPEAVIVVHNGAVTPRESWDEIPVKDGDTLEILKMMGGG